jgi:hypothetical protein
MRLKDWLIDHWLAVLIAVIAFVFLFPLLTVNLVHP